MKKQIRIFSAFLAVLLFLGAFATLGTLGLSAAEAAPTGEKTNVRVQKDYVQRKVFNTPQDKLDSMTLKLSKYGFSLYSDAVSGEVAVVENANPNNVMFTNPYDVASSSASDGASSNGTSSGTKEQILSQIVVKYKEPSKEQTADMYSFVEAAMRGQIDVSNIRDGIRVEYTIGREEMRKLVPRWIPAESFNELIHAPLQEAADSNEWKDGWFYLQKFDSYYSIKSLEQEETEAARKTLLDNYPICSEMDIYVFDSNATDKEISDVEGYIKEYCSDTYSFEQMDADHEATGYEATDEEYPVFKMALEYTLSDTGFSVRLSCNGLQYNMASYMLESISILPYMGAGNSKNPGYNFYPDGSGSLFDYEQLKDKQTSISAKIYGLDYAYHEITGATYQRTVRMPVFGSVSTEKIYSYTDIDTGAKVRVSNTVKTLESILEKGYSEDQIKTETYQRGYVAVIENGESLGSLQTYHAGVLSEYATIMNFFNPKPKDSYDIADSISVTSSHTWTVVSNRKYTGNIRINYQMLTDAEDGAEILAAKTAAGESYKYYDATWLGMAEAYRDYLIANKTLTKLEQKDLTPDIPMYLEVFGAMKTQQTILTVPVDVMTPLTTFENIVSMYDQLASSGIRNVNFKMTGFANGGMYATMPSSLKWEKAVGGASGFRDLIEKAAEVNENDENANFGLYPDFDFAYSRSDTLFDSLNLKKDAIRTIDNRYTSKRIYSATQQKYVSFYQLAISPSRYSKFYTKLLKNYSKYDLKTMSVSTLGNALNSDFDEDDPFNREDSKDFTVKAFQDLQKEGYSLMTDGGNAYTWAYVDHIVNMELDSSRYTQSSCSVPFLGAVLHGYIQFAGTPLNQEGDTDYAILKAVENGAGMYFILSYQNTSELKEDEFLSQYYSINYDIWFDDMVNYYNTLNDLMKDVQTKVIIDHKFLNDEDGYGTTRLLDIDELQAQIRKELEAAKKEAEDKREAEKISEIASIADAMVSIRTAQTRIEAILKQMKTQNEAVKTAYTKVSDAKMNVLNTDVIDGTFKQEAIKAMLAYGQLAYYGQQITEIFTQMDADLALLQAKLEGTDKEYQYNDAKNVVDTLKATTLQADAQDELNAYQAYVTGAASFSEGIQTIATDVLNYADLHGLWTASTEQYKFTFAEIVADGTYIPPVNADENGTTGSGEVAATSTYSVNNNKVVAVTYGDIDENRNKTAYKTFILNYNNFTVRTVYNSVEYTIPAYGYVVLYH